MTDGPETKNPRLLLVRKEIPPVFVRCEECKAWEPFRRHPSEHTGECRRYTPTGSLEVLGALPCYRAKWPVTFCSEGCFEGIAGRISPTIKERTS